MRTHKALFVNAFRQRLDFASKGTSDLFQLCSNTLYIIKVFLDEVVRLTVIELTLLEGLDNSPAVEALTTDVKLARRYALMTAFVIFVALERDSKELMSATT